MFSLASGKAFSRLDRQILLALSRYGYLNAFLLKKYATAQGNSGATQQAVKERLSFLVKNGMVFRYEFFHKDPYTAAVEGSPFVYSLSGGGWMFLKVSYRMHLASSGKQRFYEFPDLKDQARIAQILGMLAENQFAVLFEGQYMGRADLTAEINGGCFARCGQRMEFRVRPPGGRLLNIFPVGVRQCGEWEQEFLAKLSGIRQYASATCGAGCSVLAICESSEHAAACEERIRKDPALSGMDVFYGLDHTIAGSPDVFGRLLDIRQAPSGAISRSYFRLDICPGSGNAAQDGERGKGKEGKGVAEDGDNRNPN